MTAKYDIAVIGGGPGGYTAAIKAAQLGARVILFEQNSVGGTCLNVGCIPTKYLLEKAGFLEKIKNDTQEGILKDAGMFSWSRIKKQKDDVIIKLTRDVTGILKKHNITIVTGRARFDTPNIVSCGDYDYKAEHVIIATGSKASVPPISGIANNKHVLDSTMALEITRVPKSLVVIGGGAIGLEFASIFHAFGTDVTILEMLPEIIATEDREISNFLQYSLKTKGINIFTDVIVKEMIKDDLCKILFEHEGQEKSVISENILLATGRSPSLDGISAKNLALNDQGYICVDEGMRTSLKDVYAIGDVTGGIQLAHAAYAQAEVAAINCIGGDAQVNLTIMPRCVYSLPQMAAVGETEERLEANSVDYVKSTLPYAANGKAVASNETTGMVKILATKNEERILGVHMAGANASELISGAIVAMNSKLTVSDFKQMIFPHPTMSEMLSEAILAIHGKE